MRASAHLFAAGVVLAGIATTSCGGSSPPERPPAPPSPPVVVVTMTEYRFRPSQKQLAPGRVVFRMVNAGDEPHSPALVPLDEDVPPIDEQVRGAERRIVAPYAGVNTRLPGATGTFAVDLVAGRRYAFVCYASTPDEKAHSKLGMTWEFRTAGTPPPSPSSTVPSSNSTPPSSDAGPSERPPS